MKIVNVFFQKMFLTMKINKIYSVINYNSISLNNKLNIKHNYLKYMNNVYEKIDNAIFFAGEHTDPLYYGSLHAAYNSGVRVLKELGLD